MAFTIDDIDTVEPPAAAPAVTPKPEPEVTAPRSQGRGFTIDDIDAEPGTAHVAAPAVPDTTVPAEKKAQDGFTAGFGRGARHGLATTPEGLAGLAAMVDDYAEGGDPDGTAKGWADWFREQAETAKGGDELRSPGALSIRSWDDAMTYLGETIGQAAGSSAGPIVGGGVGAAIGAGTGAVLAPGVGAIPGAATGFTVGQAITNIGPAMGTMRNAIHADPAIQKKIQDGELSKRELLPYAAIGGGIIGGLDAISTEAMGIKLPAAKVVKEVVEMSVRKAILHGAKTEGLTEALQQIVEDVTVGLSGGEVDVQKSLRSTVESAIAGVIGGTAITGATEAGGKLLSDKPADPTRVDKETPEGAGQSTPGGTGAPPPPPVKETAGAPAAQEPGGITVDPPGTVDKDAEAALVGQPVVTPASAPPTSVAAASVPRETPVAEEAEVTDNEVVDEALYELPELQAAMKIRPTTARETGEIRIAAPRDDVIAALEAGPPEPIGAGQSPPSQRPPAPAEQPALTPPGPSPVVQGNPPAPMVEPGAAAPQVGKPLAAPQIESPPAAIVPEPPSDTKAQIAALSDPTSGKDAMIITPNTPVNPADLQGLGHVTTNQGLFVSSNPAKLQAVQQSGGKLTTDQLGGLLGYTTPKQATDGTVVQAKDPAGNVVHEELTNQPMLPASVEQAQGMAPEGGQVEVTDGHTALAERQAGLPAAPAPVEDTSAAPAGSVTPGTVSPTLSRRAADAVRQLRDLLRASLDPDQHTPQAIDETIEEVIHGITPRLAESPDAPGRMVAKFEKEAIATAKARVEAKAEETARAEAEAGEQQDEKAREVAKEARAKGAPQERGRTTREGTKPAADLKAEGAADRTPFAKRAKKAVEKGNAPAFYKKGLDAIEALSKIGRGNFKAGSEKYNQRVEANRQLAEARAEEVAAAEAQEKAELETLKAEEKAPLPEKETGGVTKKDRAKALRKYRAKRAKAGLTTKVDPQLSAAIREMELPDWKGYGTKAWANDVRAAINKLLREFPPKDKGGTEIKSFSFDAAPETNFLVYAKKQMKTDEGLTNIYAAKQFIDRGDMVEASNMMREVDDFSYGAGGLTAEELADEKHVAKELEKAGVKLQGKTEEEVTAKAGTYEQEQAQLEGWDEEEEIGDYGYVSDDQSAFALEGGKPTTFTVYGKDDKPSQIPVSAEQTSTVSEQFKDLSGKVGEINSPFLKNIPNVLRKNFVKRIGELVGNTPTYMVSRAEIMAAMKERQRGQVNNALGLYVRPTTEERANGSIGHILINADDHAHQTEAERMWVVLHEATHAATHAAIDNNWNGSREIIARMYRWSQKQTMFKNDYYGLRADNLFPGLHEFVAEAFSNLEFQERLAGIILPETLRKDVLAFDRGGRTTMWDMFLSAVSTGLGKLGWGKQQLSMLEAVIRIAPTIALSTNTQQQLAARQVETDLEKALNATGEPRGHADPLPLVKAVTGGFEATRQQKTNVAGGLRRRHMSWMETSMGLARRSAALFGGEKNPLSQAIESLQKRDSAAFHHREEANEVAGELNTFQKRHATEAVAMRDVLYDSSLAGVDPRLDVAGNVAKKNVSKNGATDAHKRHIIEKQHAAWNKLSPEAKRVANRLMDYYTKDNADNVSLQLKRAVKQIVDSGVTLPKGVSEADLLQWVQSKQVHRTTDSAINKRNAFDEEMHKALGGSAQTLADLEKTLQHKGIYVPFMREGKWVVSGSEKVAVPKGATVVPPHAMPKNKNLDNLLLFENEKDVRAYQKQAVEDGVQISGVDSIWVDPNTGKRVSKLSDDNSVQRYVVHVQNKVVEFVDSEAAAKARTKELKGQGLTMNGHRLRDEFYAGIGDVSPAHVQRLLHAVDQQQGKDGDMAGFLKSQIQLAALRTSAGTRAKHRNIKRRGVKGHSRDALRALLDYSVASSHFKASLQEGADAWDHIKDARQYAEDHKTDISDNEVQKRAELINETVARLSSRHWANNSGDNLLRQVLSYSAIVHLASPAYSAINAAQPIMTTLPHLSGKYGLGTTLREMGRAYARLGLLRTSWRGLMRTGQAIRKWGNAPVFSNHADLVKAFAKDKDASLLNKLFDHLRDVGLLDTGGIEQELVEYGKSKASQMIHRVSVIARALPQTIEGLNRGVTAVASIRAQMALDPTLDEETAIRRAMHDVEQTQFGYSAANMPNVMQSQAGSVLLQFKKYSLSMGNLIGHNMVDALGPDIKGPARVRAIKTLIGLTLTGVAFAGVAGIPGSEMFKIMAMILAGTLGTGDWGDAEAWMQKELGKFVGAGPAEYLTRGVPRALNIDMSSRVGYDSMFTFGEPKKLDEAEMKAWLFNAIGGPAVGMATTLVKAATSGDWRNLPLPKMMNDALKAKKKFDTGEYDASKATIKTLGFTPGSDMAKFESGPDRAGMKKNEQKKEAQAERTSAMKGWLAIPEGPKRADARQAAWENDVVPYNKANPKNRITKNDLHVALRKRQTDRRKVIREEARAS